MSITEYEAKPRKTGAGTSRNGGDCGCGGITCAGGELVSLERTRFFPRQLIGPDDLTQDQTYFREKARRHNRLMHGWGIVCGADVHPGDKPCEVLVKPGYIVGPYGDEIVLDREVTFDVCSQDSSLDPCGGVDPWCTDVRAHRREGEELYLAIRATERETRPVRVTACGCGCDDTECEYSRVRDSFELAVLKGLPEDYRDLEKLTPLQEIMQLAGVFSCLTGARGCPPCPASPWVVLADLSLDAEHHVSPKGAPHRRYVASFADFYFRCLRDATPALVSMAKLYGQSAQAMYVDAQAMGKAGGEAPTPPAATVAAKDGSGRWLTVPGTFEVEPGETLGKMLTREGGRTLVDAGSGETATVRELFAAADADPRAKVHSVADALSHLEAQTLDVPGLRVVRSAYEDVIDKHGLESLDDAHGGSPAAAPQLAATALRGVEAESAVGEYVAKKSVADVAAETRSRFVAAATKGLKGGRREAETERAQQVWENARRVATLSAAWHP
jgi:hypothetical protein